MSTGDRPSVPISAEPVPHPPSRRMRGQRKSRRYGSGRCEGGRCGSARREGGRCESAQCESAQCESGRRESGRRESRLQTGGRNEADRGAASIFVLAVGLVLIAVGMAGTAVIAARAAKHQAQNAADLGALAGARHAVEGDAVACAEAARLVVANGARLADCALSGLEIVVRAEVVVTPIVGGTWTATKSARAGPAYAVPTPGRPA